MSQKYEKLKILVKELLQLDRPVITDVGLFLNLLARRLGTADCSL